MRVAWRNFTGGELADTLSARYDLSRYQTSARHMENFLPNLHGDAVRRPACALLRSWTALRCCCPLPSIPRRIRISC